MAKKFSEHLVMDKNSTFRDYHPPHTFGASLPPATGLWTAQPQAQPMCNRISLEALGSESSRRKSYICSGVYIRLTRIKVV